MRKYSKKVERESNERQQREPPRMLREAESFFNIQKF